MITIEFDNPNNDNVSELLRVYTLDDHTDISSFYDDVGASDCDELFSNLESKCINLSNDSKIKAYLVPMECVECPQLDTTTLNCEVLCTGVDDSDISTLTRIAAKTFDWLKEHNFKPAWKTVKVLVQLFGTIEVTADQLTNIGEDNILSAIRKHGLTVGCECQVPECKENDDAGLKGYKVVLLPKDVHLSIDG